jgi:hypothetical protein
MRRGVPIGRATLLGVLLGTAFGQAMASAGEIRATTPPGSSFAAAPALTGARHAVSLRGGGGRRFYLDARRGDNANDGRDPRRAWRSLERLQAAVLRPGDTVAFRRGARYSGNARVAASGTARQPITLTAYGAGAAPVLTNPGGLNMLYVTGDHVRIGNLRFLRGVTFGKIRVRNYMRSGAVAIATGADDVTVENNEFVAVGIGVKTYGLRTRITHNTFRDLSIAFRGIDHDTRRETSYGAVGISLNNSAADVGWNAFIDCRSTDSPYGADGGAVEIEGFAHTKDRIRIHHNFSAGSQGFVEVTETSTSNVEIAYNVSDDYQQFLAFDTTTSPRRYRVLHNTVLRRSSLNATAVFTIFHYRDRGPRPSEEWLSIRDNVFYLPAAKALRGSYTYKAFDFPHDHNVFAGQEDPVGYPLGNGDVVADPLFANDPPPLPSFVDDPRALRLRAGSPAIDRAVTRPAPVDILGRPVPRGGRPDAGAIERVTGQISIETGHQLGIKLKETDCNSDPVHACWA